MCSVSVLFAGVFRERLFHYAIYTVCECEANTEMEAAKMQAKTKENEEEKEQNAQ